MICDTASLVTALQACRSRLTMAKSRVMCVLLSRPQERTIMTSLKWPNLEYRERHASSAHQSSTITPHTSNPQPHPASLQVLLVMKSGNPDRNLSVQIIHTSASTRASRSLATTHPSSRPTSAVSHSHHHHHQYHSVVRLPLPLVLPVVAPVLVVVVVVVFVKSVSSDRDVPPPRQKSKKMSWPGRGRRYVSDRAALLYFSGYHYR